jgi:hypothetical protein
VFHARIPNAEGIVKGKGNVFQRLNDTADLYWAHLAIDLRAAPGVAWAAALRLWAARHVHTHNGGRVDEKYLKAVPETTLMLGQRVIVPAADARSAIALATALCKAASVRSP